ncbi:MAG: PSD1 and planctomycete cytochrome C domain-containing protein [Chthoniobacteraceae bacterium]
MKAYLSTFAALLSALPALAVDFRREVRPILASRCYDCHADQKPKGGLRLTSRANALKGGESETPAFVAGQSAKSEMINRLTSTDPDEKMPPKGERLITREIDTLKRWIDAGAEWPENVKHWAYEVPTRRAVPKVGKPEVGSRKSEAANPIDAFVLQRLAEEKLMPSPEAEPETIIRRMTLDLTGLPPTPDEVATFVREYQSPGTAVEHLADRLLASPQFGVRWARPWLDLARYADSHGFQRDDLRELWPYRDWVVRALNADMPFDQFTIEQLAGDLLPNATDDQIIATGFNRGTPCNVEAGTEPEENRVNQVFDRVNTLGAVWLGTTLECSQCHDHKFDPITRRDYYQLFAFFNNTALEADRANPKVPGSIKFLGPYHDVKDTAKDAAHAAIDAERTKLLKGIATREALLAKDAAAWEAQLAAEEGKTAQEHVLEIADFESAGGSAHRILEDRSVLLSDDNAPATDTYTVTVKTPLTGITGIKLEALTDPSLPGEGPGRGDAARPNFVLNEFIVTATPSAGGEPTRVKFSKATASFSQKNFDVSELLTDVRGDKQNGWAINPEFHKPHWALFECAEPLGVAGGTTLTFKLAQNFGAGRTIGRLRLSALTGKIGGTPLPSEVSEILALHREKRTPAQAKKLADFRAKEDRPLTDLREQLRKADVRLLGLKKEQTLVMQEIAEPRMSTMFNRGVYTDRGEPVQPGTPAILTVAKPEQRTRLDLARWLVSRDNPLTARVVVNRWWAEIFGRGIVGTPEDFGIKGEQPTHPELLDWLAVEFMDGGWSMKKTLRTIVTSATYRQSSRITPELFARDDQNKLLARGPRHRLDAEAIRDNALAISGLLSLKQGGAPIRPPQPDGLWDKVGGQKYDYVVSPGEEKFRRGLYVVLKRGAPYPSFVNFDASARMACTVKRSRSNTPLQALTLLNDPVFVEAAQAFAKRIVAEQPTSDVDARVRYAFRLAVARAPKDDELRVLKALFEAERTAAGESAAWYAVATALLNLDETITKG